MRLFYYLKEGDGECGSKKNLKKNLEGNKFVIQ